VKMNEAIKRILRWNAQFNAESAPGKGQAKAYEVSVRA